MRFSNKCCADSDSVFCPLHFKRLARLSLLLLPVGLSLRARADGPLLPVHLRAGGREVVCKTPPLADNDETYIPVEALPALGLEGKIDGKGETARVTILATRQHEDLAVARPNGKSMLALFDVARLLNGHIVRTEILGRDNKPVPGSKGDTIYLLARLTDARMQNGALRVTTSFPVPYHVRPSLDGKPNHAFVECVGAEAPANFRPTFVTSPAAPASNLDTVAIRAQQVSIDTARVSADLPDGVTLKMQGMDVNPGQVIVVETGKADAQVARADRKSGVRPGKGTARETTKETNKEINKGASGAKNTQIARAGDPSAVRVSKNSNAGGAAPVVPTPSSDQGAGGVQQPGSLSPEKNSGKTTGDASQTPASPASTPNSDPANSNGADTPKKSSSSAPVRPSLRGKLPSRAGSVKRNTPVEVRGLAVAPDGDQRVHLDIATSDAVGTYIHYLPDGKLAIDIPNALLHLPEGMSADQGLAHPLLNGIHAELLQDSPPLTRITCDTPRIVGFTVNNQSNNKITVDLRLPRNATGALADKVIVVDAGHGGSSSGAPGGGYLEKNITLQISLKLRDILESCGAKVVMTRDKDVDVNLYDRPQLANDINADLFVSIHNDSFTSDSRGTSTYYHMNDPSSRALANVVQQAIVAVSGIPSKGALSDGILYNSGLAVLRASKMPAILVEVAYISNAQDRKRLVDSDFQQRVAQAICDGLRMYVEGGTPNGGRRMGMDVPDAPPLPGDDSASKVNP